ncbi:alpha/beta fold hydrolase [Qipengyuania sp.]|uniref:alpha/beta fold hydrolase n=1 Tax=Qipengyuania sp. TaxID=2004515 RepID=UPI003AF80162
MPAFSRAIVTFAALALPHTAQAQMAPTTSEGKFVPCAEGASLPALAETQCARVASPLDHAAPAKGDIELFVRKFPARGTSQGELWLIAGSPGESGASFYPFIDTLRAAAPGFDLIIPDHRGTGFSTRLCPNEESAESAGGTALEGAEWGSCIGAMHADPERTQSFSITNAAHDIELLMERLGTGDRTYLYGVSYGTQLVLRTLTVAAPAGLDGVILDSLVPADDDERHDLSRRSQVTDAVGRQVLRGCDARADCSRYFDRPVEQALEELLANPELSKPLGPKPKYLLSTMLDFPETRAALPFVIAGLRAGDTAWLDHAQAQLAKVQARFAPYPQFGSSIPLVSLISGSENNRRPALTAETIDSEEAGLLFTSPLPRHLLPGGFPTYEAGPELGQLPESIPPTLVLHGKLDPKTAHDGAKAYVDRLRAAGEIELASSETAPHYLLMTDPDFFVAQVRAFLAE